MCDEDREALIDRAHEALRRADATLKATNYTGPRPFARAEAYMREFEQRTANKEPKIMASHSPEYITKADARQAQDRVEHAIGIVVARQRDALEQRSATLFDLLAELDSRWTAIEARVAKLEAAMSIASTSGDEAAN
jgi:hypothetical protein